MTKISILLVDDQEELLEITRLFLEKGGEISVDTSTSAIKALDMLKEKKYDAIVSDYEMPLMNGIEFLKTIKRSGIEKPFIIFTGRSREDIVIEALNNGADFYLQKGTEPKVQFAELRNMIHQAVMRKRVEEALIQSETNYQTLVECTQDSIYMVDKKGRYLFLNSHHRQRLGIAGEDCQNYYYEDLHTETESGQFLAQLKTVIENGIHVHDEYEKDGRWFYRTISPVKNEIMDLTIAATVISTEITHTRILESTVDSLEKYYQIVVEAMQDSIYTVDKECRYRFMNSHHRKRLGITGQYLGKGYGDFHNPEETERFASHIWQVIATGETVSEEYSRDSRTFVRTYSPVRDKDTSQVKEIVIVSIDPHDRTGEPFPS